MPLLHLASVLLFSNFSLSLSLARFPHRVSFARAHVAGHEVGCVLVAFPEIGSFPREVLPGRSVPNRLLPMVLTRKLTFLLLLLVHLLSRTRQRRRRGARETWGTFAILNTVDDPRILCMLCMQSSSSVQIVVVVDP